MRKNLEDGWPAAVTELVLLVRVVLRWHRVDEAPFGVCSWHDWPVGRHTLGFVLQLPPVLIGLLSALGSTVATVLVMVLGERVRARLVRRRPAAEGVSRERLIDRVWRRYGIIGLGLLAPCLTGAPIGIAMGILLRAPAGRMLFWLLIGIVLWTVILTGAGVYGSAGVRHLITR